MFGSRHGCNERDRPDAFVAVVDYTRLMVVQPRAFLGCVAYESKSCHEGLRDEEAAADEPPSNHIDCEDGVSPLPADYRQHADSHVPRVDEVRYLLRIGSTGGVVEGLSYGRKYIPQWVTAH